DRHHSCLMDARMRCHRKTGVRIRCRRMNRTDASTSHRRIPSSAHRNTEMLSVHMLRYSSAMNAHTIRILGYSPCTMAKVEAHSSLHVAHWIEAYLVPRLHEASSSGCLRVVNSSDSFREASTRTGRDPCWPRADVEHCFEHPSAVTNNGHSFRRGKSSRDSYRPCSYLPCFANLDCQHSVDAAPNVSPCRPPSVWSCWMR